MADINKSDDGGSSASSKHNRKQVNSNSANKGKTVKFSKRAHQISVHRNALAVSQGRDQAGLSATQRYLSQGSGQIVTIKDAHFEFTDYVDYNVPAADPPAVDQSILSYGWETKQNLLAQGADGGEGLLQCRLKWCKVYVLNRSVNAGNADETFAVATAIPTVTGDGSTLLLIGTQTTVVKPDFKTTWTKVIDYQVNKLFKNSESLPLVNGSVQDCFQLEIINPDDLSNITAQKYQLCIKLGIEQSIAPSIKAVFGVAYGAEFGERITTVATTQNAFLNLTGVSNTV